MLRARTIDLFSGAGGLALGAAWAGAEVEHAIEFDAWACDTLRTNHGKSVRVHQADITALGDEWIAREIQPYPDLIVGGPPCQGFSHAGRPDKDPSDPRNSLFKEFVRFVRLLEPRSILMENVPGILRATTVEGRPVRDIVRSELEALGYQVNIVTLHAENYGVPQIRKRVFFLGSLEGMPSEPPATHGAGDLLDGVMPRVRTVADAIGDLPLVDVGFRGPTVKYSGPPSNDFQRLMREGADNVLWNHLPMRHSQRTVARFAQIAPGQSQSHVSAEYAPRRRVRSVEEGAASYDQNNRRQFWDRPCHTLAASFYANFVHPELNRNFTPREGARIQSFPDWYRFEGKPTVVSRKLLAREGREGERHLCQYNQIGNAVPPLLAKLVVGSVLLGKLAPEPLPAL